MPYPLANFGHLDHLTQEQNQQQQNNTTCSVTGINVATFDLVEDLNQQQLDSLWGLA